MRCILILPAFFISFIYFLLVGCGGVMDSEMNVGKFFINMAGSVMRNTRKVGCGGVIGSGSE